MLTSLWHSNNKYNFLYELVGTRGHKKKVTRDSGLEQLGNKDTARSVVAT